jgi:hypothetical protein
MSYTTISNIDELLLEHFVNNKFCPVRIWQDSFPITEKFITHTHKKSSYTQVSKYNMMNLLIVITCLLFLCGAAFVQGVDIETIGKGKAITDSVSRREWKYYKIVMPPDYHLTVTIEETNYKYCQVSTYLRKDTIPTEQVADGSSLVSFTQGLQQFSVVDDSSKQSSEPGEAVYYLGVKGEFCYNTKSSGSEYTLKVDWKLNDSLLHKRMIIMVVVFSAVGCLILLCVTISIAIGAKCCWTRYMRKVYYGTSVPKSERKNSLVIVRRSSIVSYSEEIIPHVLIVPNDLSPVTPTAASSLLP